MITDHPGQPDGGALNLSDRTAMLGAKPKRRGDRRHAASHPLVCIRLALNGSGSGVSTGLIRSRQYDATSVNASVTSSISISIKLTRFTRNRRRAADIRRSASQGVGYDYRHAPIYDAIQLAYVGLRMIKQLD